MKKFSFMLKQQPFLAPVIDPTRIGFRTAASVPILDPEIGYRSVRLRLQEADVVLRTLPCLERHSLCHVAIDPLHPAADEFPAACMLDIDDGKPSVGVLREKQVAIGVGEFTVLLVNFIHEKLQMFCGKSLRIFPRNVLVIYPDLFLERDPILDPIMDPIDLDQDPIGIAFRSPAGWSFLFHDQWLFEFIP